MGDYIQQAEARGHRAAVAEIAGKLDLPADRECQGAPDGKPCRWESGVIHSDCHGSGRIPLTTDDLVEAIRGERDAARQRIEELEIALHERNPLSPALDYDR